MPADDPSRAWLPKSLDDIRKSERAFYLFIFNLEEKPQTMFDFVEQN